jgi:hypothetical protein
MDPTNKEIFEAIVKLDKFVVTSTKFDTFTLAVTIISFIFLIVGFSYTIYQNVKLHKLLKTTMDEAPVADGGANTTTSKK